MIVEFFGIPGCGKSTLAHATAAHLRAIGVAVDEPTFLLDRRSSMPRIGRKAAQALHHGLANPGTALVDALRIVKSGQPDARTTFKCLMNWLMIGRNVSRAPLNPVTFLDQGIAQAVWSIGLSARNTAWLSEVMDAVDIGPIDAIVHVTAPMAIIEARLSRRTSRSSRLNRAELDDIVRAGALADDIVKRFRKRGTVIHDASSNDTSVVPRAEALARVIETAIGRAGYHASPNQSLGPAKRHAGALQ